MRVAMHVSLGIRAARMDPSLDDLKSHGLKAAQANPADLSSLHKATGLQDLQVLQYGG